MGMVNSNRPEGISFRAYQEVFPMDLSQLKIAGAFMHWPIQAPTILIIHGILSESMGCKKKAARYKD